MREIKAETIGFNSSTRVVCNDRILETQKLDIETLCNLWKWYYNIPPFEEVRLKCDTRLYYSLMQKPLWSCKSVIDLFEEQGIKVVEIKADMVEVCDD